MDFSLSTFQPCQTRYVTSIKTMQLCLTLYKVFHVLREQSLEDFDSSYSTVFSIQLKLTGNLAEVAEKMVQRLSDVNCRQKNLIQTWLQQQIIVLYECRVSNCILKTQATMRSRLNFVYICVCYPTVIRPRIFPRVVTLLPRNLWGMYRVTIQVVP